MDKQFLSDGCICCETHQTVYYATSCSLMKQAEQVLYDWQQPNFDFLLEGNGHSKSLAFEVMARIDAEQEVDNFRIISHLA